MRQVINLAAQASSNRNKISHNTIGNNTRAPLSSLILSVVGGQRWYRGTVAGAWRYRLIWGRRVTQGDGRLSSRAAQPFDLKRAWRRHLAYLRGCTPLISFFFTFSRYCTRSIDYAKNIFSLRFPKPKIKRKSRYCSKSVILLYSLLEARSEVNGNKAADIVPVPKTYNLRMDLYC